MAWVGIGSAKQGALSGALAGVASINKPVTDSVSSGLLQGVGVSRPSSGFVSVTPEISTSEYNVPSYVIQDVADTLEKVNNNAIANTAKSMEEAKINREWQEAQNAKAMEFNRIEAEKNRNWQEMLSNTAHQREIADLKAAGLNPVLSAMNGNGASVTSGATASGVTSSGSTGQVDTSANSALVNLISAVYNRSMDVQMAHINAKYNLNQFDAQLKLERDLAELAREHDFSLEDVKHKHQLGETAIGSIGNIIGSIAKVVALFV